MGNNMTKPVILTGIRSNEDPTLGNYFGALLPLIDMAKRRGDDFEVNLFVPDLHSFTTPTDHAKLYQKTINNLKIFVAAGLPLDQPNVHIYRQSCIPAHSELTWILDCFTGFGEMSRMTQFKDKSAKLADDRISVGLFNYPVRFGDKYPDGLFTVPKPVKEQHEFFGKDQGLRIKDLQDPTKKMSKSDENGKGVIFLGDDPVVAAKKIRSATTDSFGKIEAANKEQAGIKNLLQLIALVTGNDLQEVTDSYEGQKQYGPLKDDAAIGIGNFLGEFQERFAAVDEAQLMAKLQADEAQMNQIANTTLLKVQKAVGLRA
jgi:tryptophanyl-tRNA synthetase